MANLQKKVINIETDNLRNLMGEKLCSAVPNQTEVVIIGHQNIFSKLKIFP
jgi:hypothetical protein